MLAEVDGRLSHPIEIYLDLPSTCFLLYLGKERTRFLPLAKDFRRQFSTEIVLTT